MKAMSGEKPFEMHRRRSNPVSGLFGGSSLDSLIAILLAGIAFIAIFHLLGMGNYQSCKHRPVLTRQEPLQVVGPAKDLFPFAKSAYESLKGLTYCTAHSTPHLAVRQADGMVEVLPRSEEAYAFLITKLTHPHYFFQGANFIRQLRAYDPNRDFIVMYTDRVSELQLHLLLSFASIGNADRAGGIYFHKVHDIVTSPNARSQQAYGDDPSAQYSGQFAKLSIFTLVEYSRVLYLDLDMVLLDGKKFLNLWNKCDDTQADVCCIIDSLGRVDGAEFINGGILLVRPNLVLYEVMAQKVFEGWMVDYWWAEQAFLSMFFHKTKFGRSQILYDKAFNPMFKWDPRVRVRGDVSSLEQDHFKVYVAHVHIPDKVNFFNESMPREIKQVFKEQFKFFASKSIAFLADIACYLGSSDFISGGTHLNPVIEHVSDKDKFMFHFKKGSPGICLLSRGKVKSPSEAFLFETLLRSLRAYFKDLVKFINKEEIYDEKMAPSFSSHLTCPLDDNLGQT
eukprot:Nk52_evm4s2133 gene=Nk52_evmTU4s2133